MSVGRKTSVPDNTGSHVTPLPEKDVWVSQEEVGMHTGEKTTIIFTPQKRVMSKME